MKTIKLSLIAALTVCSISGVNAKDLSDKTIESLEKLASAVENIKVSGTAIYRYNDYENNEAQNIYKVATNISAKANENITVNSRIIIGNADDNDSNVKIIKSRSSDSGIDGKMTEFNFVYTGIENTSITLGKQGIDNVFSTPRSATGDEQSGNGLTAKIKIANTTLGAGIFNTTNLDESGKRKGEFSATNGTEGNDLGYLTAMTSFSNVKLDVGYLTANDLFDMYSVGMSLKTNLSDVKLNAFARYTSADYENLDGTNSLWKVGVKGKSGIFGALLAYGETNEEGGGVGLDDGADTGFDEHWRVTLTEISDASTLYASINAQVTPTVNLALKYSDLSAGSKSNDVDQNEIYVQIAYNMSSNLKSYIRLGQFDKEGSEKASIGRLNIGYSF